jgi:rod shape-determining protein MreD
MQQSSPAASFVVFASILIAMVLRILPVPENWAYFNPDWVLLVLMYWSMAIPEKVGVGYAWVVGLFSDMLTGRLLGQHALAYALVAYICVKMHRQLRLYPLYQQMLPVLLLLLLGQLLIFWTQNIKAASAIGWVYWLPSLMGTLVWPLVLLTLRNLRRSFSIF